MDTLKRWLAQKGDNAASALDKVLTDLGYSTNAVIEAIESEQKVARINDLAASLAVEGVDEVELADAIARKKTAGREVAP